MFLPLAKTGCANKEISMARKKDFIPRRDDDFFNFQGKLVNMVVANQVAWGIPDNIYPLSRSQEGKR